MQVDQETTLFLKEVDYQKEHEAGRKSCDLMGAFYHLLRMAIPSIYSISGEINHKRDM